MDYVWTAIYQVVTLGCKDHPPAVAAPAVIGIGPESIYLRQHVNTSVIYIHKPQLTLPVPYGECAVLCRRNHKPAAIGRGLEMAEREFVTGLDQGYNPITHLTCHRVKLNRSYVIVHVSYAVRLIMMSRTAKEDGAAVGRKTRECLLIFLPARGRTVSHSEIIKINHHQVTALVIHLHPLVKATVNGERDIGCSENTVAAILRDVTIYRVAGLVGSGIKLDGLAVAVQYGAAVRPAQMHE